MVVVPPPHSPQIVRRLAQPTCCPAAGPVAAECSQSDGFRSIRLSAVPFHRAAWVLALPACWPLLTARPVPTPRSTVLPASPFHTIAWLTTVGPVAVSVTKPALPICCVAERPATEAVAEPAGVKSIIV